MPECERIRAVLMRGGTSKGVYLLASDLPRDPQQRDEVLLAIMGSPDSRQINGLGGADPLTSKVAIIARSSRPDADVDYTIGYVSVDKPHVDYEGNCGNILQGVGPFAVDEGLVPVTEPMTRVRVFNTNTRKIIEAEVPVRNGKAVVEGDFTVFGVPGTGAKIVLNFLNSAGSKTGKLLPTGNVRDCITLSDGRRIEVSCVDAGNPFVFAQAVQLGFTGRELPKDSAANPAIVATLEEIRRRGAVLMGLAETPEGAGPAVPKVAMVAAPQNYATVLGTTIPAADCDVVARNLALSVLHKAYAVTGGFCVGTAALMEGSVVHEVAGPGIAARGLVRVGHPSGVSEYWVSVEKSADGGFELTKSAVAGTARRIMDGFVYVPQRLLAGR